MIVKLSVSKSQMYNLIKAHAEQMNPDIKAEEISRINNTTFKRSAQNSFYQLDFSTKYKSYRASLGTAWGSAYLQIKDKDIFASGRREWQMKIAESELRERNMIAAISNKGIEL